jgi:iron complex outermembrane receptor protein
LNAGIRYDTAFVTTQQNEWIPDTGDIRPFEKESTRWDAFVYEAGVTVNPLDFIKVYAKYGTLFRYPYIDDFISVSTSSGDGPIVIWNTELEPEKGWTVEGGVGINFKGLVKFDANLYFMKIDNELTSNPRTGTLNVDPIERLGYNIGFNLSPVKYMELDVDYGFVNAEFSEGQYKYKYVPLVANDTLSASLMLHAPFGLSFGPNLRYNGEMYMGMDFDNAHPALDSSVVWGLQARYVVNRFNGEIAVMLTVHNLANTKYGALVYLMGPSTVYWVDNNMGRSVNVSVQYRF